MNNLYIYNDNSAKRVLFQCFANSILEADKMLLEACSIKADKSPQVGCEVYSDFKDISEEEAAYYELCCSI